MERHRCKICTRRFSSGRALGGHMRSHLAKLPIPPKTQHPPDLKDPSESAPSELSFLAYSNPDADSDSAVYYNGESETESSKTPFQKRLKRPHKSVVEQETACSVVVDANPEEEEAALALMMLSRDKWTKPKEADADAEMADEMEDDSFCQTQKRTRSRVMYLCDTCNKLFRSFQALGGHRVSHKQIKTQGPEEQGEKIGVGGDNGVNQRIYECPFCFKVFQSGQALGGHKKIHTSNTAEASSSARNGIKFIDLNLPAPEEDEDFSQVEVSAVSDAGMQHSIRR